ncbi:unnamed protein product [Merluccius merluccius]
MLHHTATTTTITVSSLGKQRTLEKAEQDALLSARLPPAHERRCSQLGFNQLVSGIPSACKWLVGPPHCKLKLGHPIQFKQKMPDPIVSMALAAEVAHLLENGATPESREELIS